MRGGGWLGVVGKQSECANHTTEKERYDRYRQREEKADGRYSSTLTHHEGEVERGTIA